jgi:hypothetical protein
MFKRPDFPAVFVFVAGAKLFWTEASLTVKSGQSILCAA